MLDELCNKGTASAGPKAAEERTRALAPAHGFSSAKLDLRPFPQPVNPSRHRFPVQPAQTDFVLKHNGLKLSFRPLKLRNQPAPTQPPWPARISPAQPAW